MHVIAHYICIVCNVQVDLEFRKQWDKLVITLDVVDRDELSGTEVVHWVMHYPVSDVCLQLPLMTVILFLKCCLWFSMLMKYLIALIRVSVHLNVLICILYISQVNMSVCLYLFSLCVAAFFSRSGPGLVCALCPCTLWLVKVGLCRRTMRCHQPWLLVLPIYDSLTGSRMLVDRYFLGNSLVKLFWWLVYTMDEIVRQVLKCIKFIGTQCSAGCVTIDIFLLASLFIYSFVN